MNIFLSLGVCIFINLFTWLLDVPLLNFSQSLSLFLVLVLLFTFMDIAENLRKIASKKGVTVNYYTVQRVDPVKESEV